jgi:hypothetical protein
MNQGQIRAFLIRHHDISYYAAITCAMNRKFLMIVGAVEA